MAISTKKLWLSLIACSIVPTILISSCSQNEEEDKVGIVNFKITSKSSHDMKITKNEILFFDNANDEDIDAQNLVLIKKVFNFDASIMDDQIIAGLKVKRVDKQTNKNSYTLVLSVNDGFSLNGKKDSLTSEPRNFITNLPIKAKAIEDITIEKRDIDDINLDGEAIDNFNIEIIKKMFIFNDSLSEKIKEGLWVKSVDHPTISNTYTLVLNAKPGFTIDKQFRL